MLGWLLTLAIDAANTVAGVANAAMTRIVLVWSTITGFLARVKGAVMGARALVVTWLASHLVAMLSIMSTLQWLAFTYVPARLSALQATILAWASQQIAVALAAARQAVGALQTWALQQLALLGRAINALQGWAVIQFASALARVGRVEGYLFGVLGTPERIAEYVVDAMAHALARWARDNAVTVGRLFVHWFSAGLVGALSTVEDLITRILFE